MANQGTDYILEIKEMYQKVVVNFVDLCEKLYLITPLEMETLFNYMLFNGYLSKERKFSNTKEFVVDKKAIIAANILAGEGVCRHISPMFKDILATYGYEAYIFACALNLGELKNGIWHYEPMTLKEQIFGNHIICLVEDATNSYFLDPMNFTHFDFAGELLGDAEGRRAFIRILFDFLVNELDVSKKLHAKFSNLKPPMPRSLRLETIHNAQKIIASHLHFLENFYQNNASTYDLVSRKLELIRK